MVVRSSARSRSRSLSSGYARRSLGAPAALFSPTQVAGLQAWYDVSQGAWQDTAGTIPCTAGSPIARLDDLSGNGRHATQATAANQPKYGFGTVTDDFSEANGTNLNGKLTDTGQAWVTSGTWSTNGGQLLASPGGRQFAHVETGMPDGKIACLFVSKATGHFPSVLGRFVDASNYFNVEFGSTTDLNLRLQRNVAGTITTLATRVGAVPDNATVEFVLRGSSLVVNENGSQVVSVSDSNHLSATKHGFSVSDGGFGPTTGTRFDNFSVTSLAGGKAVSVHSEVANQWLGSPAFAVPQPLTIVAVLNNAAGDRWASGADTALRMGSDSAVAAVYAGTTDVTDNVNRWNDPARIYTALVRGATTQMLVDGAVVATGNPGPNGVSGGFEVGRSLGQAASARVAAVLVFEGALSYADRQAIESYLATRFGITLTP